jgi:hypothetical protein
MTFDGRSELNGNFFDESAIRSNFGQEMMGILENSINQRFNEAEELFDDPDSNFIFNFFKNRFRNGYSKLLVPTMRGLWTLLFGALVPYQVYMLNTTPKAFKVPNTTPEKKVTLNYDFIAKVEINTHLNATEAEISSEPLPEGLQEKNAKLVKSDLIRQRKLRDIEINLLNLNLPLSSITEAMALFPSNFDKKIYEDLLSYNTNRNKFMENYRRQKAAQKTS